MSGRSALPGPLGLDPDRRAHIRLGRAHVRHGDRQRDPGLVRGRRPARRMRPARPRRVGGRARPGGWSPRAPTCSTSAASRPGRATRPVDEAEELRRVVPVVAALRAALPDVPISIDTTKPAVAAAALDAGATLLNDVWGVGRRRRPRPARRRAPASRCPDAQPRRAELREPDGRDRRRPRAGDRAGRRGSAVRRDDADRRPGLRLRQDRRPQPDPLARAGRELRVLGRPILLGTSRKSTLGRVLDLPADQRLEATLATTALGIAAGVDIVRVHDVLANVRVARMTDAIVR